SNDTDGDGLPDDWELGHELDPTNANDAALDPDGDGLTNLEEFKHSTNPNSKDTDGDGIPDGWEVVYGLDPTDSTDAQVDIDGDSLVNLREFEIGTDPTLKDTDGDGYWDNKDDFPTDPTEYKRPGKTDDGLGSEFFTIIFIIMIAIIILIMIVMSIVRSKKRKGGEIFDKREQISDRHDLPEGSLTEDFQVPEVVAGESDEFITNLKQEALTPEKPSDFGPSNQEMLAGFDEKYQRGEISQTTFDSIKDMLTKPDQ
ncbi:MAG: hypothetical protein KAJ51_10980, partial [Thermoplasmata archaeon]|nr:hypothetical protein [Thermoplasmata archaeon]